MSNVYENKETIKKKQILIASKNESKIADLKLYLQDDFEILTLKDFPQYDIKIEEGITSAEDNAIAKARTWCNLTGLITIGDDTGFFIHELNGEPGVATRRWGGQLPEEATNAEFWDYLKQKTKNLKDYSCHFEHNIAVSFPNGETKVIKSFNYGVLNKNKLDKDYNGTGYPLGAVFESTDRNKNWDEMTDAEKKEFDKLLIKELKDTINSI